MATPDLKKIEIGGGRVVSYREAGEGTPLVILHGLGGRSESWAPQYEELSNRWRVIGWDAPGYGESSEMPADDPDIAAYMGVAKDFTDALGLEEFHLMGHSVGTCIAAAFHKNYGDQLLSLTLAEAVIGNGADPKDKQEAAIAARIRDLKEVGPEKMAETRTPKSLSPNADPAAVAAAVEFAKGMQVPGYTKLFKALVRCNIFDFTCPLECPGLIVAGSDDSSAPREQVAEIAAAYPDIDHRIIDGIGHQIAFEKPDVFVGMLREFLSGVEEAAQAAE
jgi:pimeloyl-ACP methyl ester carboxylesterase